MAGTKGYDMRDFCSTAVVGGRTGVDMQCYIRGVDHKAIMFIAVKTEN